MNTLGERLKYMRKTTNTSQEALAKGTGVSRSNISKIENNEINPTSNSIIAMAKYFNSTTDWLLTGKNSILQDIAEVADNIENTTVHDISYSYGVASEERLKALKLLDKLDCETLSRVVEFMEFELFKKK